MTSPSPSTNMSPPRRPMLLDGGMGHQLKAMGVVIEGQVGTLQRFLGVAMANVDTPDLVRDAHLAFIDAGADMITTNSYAVTPRVFELCTNSNSGGVGNNHKDNNHNNHNLSLESMLVAACRAACAARDMRPDRSIRIAGCLPPLAESYRPDLVGTFENNVQDYRRIVAHLAPYCDVILCETMSSADEAKAACTAAAEVGLPVYISWTLDEGKPLLRSGETLEEAVHALSLVANHHNVKGYLINCTSPESCTKALPILHSLVSSKKAAAGGNNNIDIDIDIGVYPNGFVTACCGHGEYRDLSEKEYYDEFVTQWLSLGATIVGGCCGIFPRHIAYVRQQLDQI